MINDPSIFKNRNPRPFRQRKSPSRHAITDSSGIIRRTDRPQKFLLPSPHFDAVQESSILKFLDQAESILTDENATENLIGRTMREIYGVLLKHRAARETDQWLTFVQSLRQHSICRVLHQDPFTFRAFSKPRGYAGDAGLMDHIYIADEGKPVPECTLVGRRIFNQTTDSSACRAVATRRGLIADFIDDLARKIDQPSILSLASGHLREADISAAVRRRLIRRFVAIDSDPDSLLEIERSFPQCNIESIHANARQIITGKVDAGTFDFIYSSGLYDYLSDGIARNLTKRLFDRLNPGGYLLLTNFLPQVECVGYMEAYMDWNLIYRDRCEMIQMTANIPEEDIAQVTAFAEEQSNIVFCLIEKRV